MAYKAVLIDDNKNTVLSLEYSLEWENLGIELAGTAYDGRSGKELIEKRIRILSSVILICHIWMDLPWWRSPVRQKTGS